jgi:hypothetical protein
MRSKWLSVILMVGLILALSSLSAQADPYRPYHHPRGKAYDWDGPRHHDFERYDRHHWRSWGGPRHPRYVEKVYAGPPVAYVAPVVGIPYAQTQPYFSQPAPRGLSGTLQYNF